LFICREHFFTSKANNVSSSSSSYDASWSVVESLFLTVRLHPDLIFETKAKELSRERWINKVGLDHLITVR
jgi:hypothetical protein